MPLFYGVVSTTNDDGLGGHDVLFHREQHGGECVRRPTQAIPGHTDGPLGCIQVAGFTEQVSEPCQRVGRNRISRRHCIIGQWLVSMHELFMIVRSKEKTAQRLIFELLHQHLGERAGELEVPVAPSGLQQTQDGVDREGVIIEVGCQVCALVLTRRQKATVLPERFPHIVERRIGRINHHLIAKHTASRPHALDHERIPRG